MEEMRNQFGGRKAQDEKGESLEQRNLGASENFFSPEEIEAIGKYISESELNDIKEEHDIDRRVNDGFSEADVVKMYAPQCGEERTRRAIAEVLKRRGQAGAKRLEDAAKSAEGPKEYRGKIKNGFFKGFTKMNLAAMAFCLAVAIGAPMDAYYGREQIKSDPKYLAYVEKYGKKEGDKLYYDEMRGLRKLRPVGDMTLSILGVMVSFGYLLRKRKDE